PAEVEKQTTLHPKEIAGRPAKEVQSRVRALAAVGVRHFVISLPAPYDMAMLHAFAKDVMPVLRDSQSLSITRQPPPSRCDGASQDRGRQSQGPVEEMPSVA